MSINGINNSNHLQAIHGLGKGKEVGKLDFNHAPPTSSVAPKKTGSLDALLPLHVVAPDYYPNVSHASRALNVFGDESRLASWHPNLVNMTQYLR
jgi:hypothetical protein